ncbi:MAG: hypothetical protein AB1485_07095, partial [Candidatus Thermoplasmatota archaeon]
MVLNRNIQKNRILKELLIVCIASLIAYISLKILLGNTLEEHAVTVFCSFMILPIIVLRILKKPLSLGKIDTGFVQGIALYLVFTAWLLCYYRFNSEFFAAFRFSSYEYLSWNFFSLLNVMP